MSNEKTILGGWTAYDVLLSEDKEVFAQAIDGLVGVNYTTISVSKQVVAGVNYRFRCDARLPSSGDKWEAVIEIYKPLEGMPHITSITRS